MPRSHKVVHLVRRFVFNEWGGTEAVVWNSALGLLEQGTPTSILATSALDEQGTEIRQGCHIERFSYHYPRLGLNRAKRQALDKKGGNPYSASLMRQLLREPARLIHCHSMQRMASMARVAAKLKQIPYVMSLHGGQYTVPQCEISDMAKSTRHSLNYGRLLDIFTRPNRALNDASGIICVGFDEYQAVKKHFPFKPTIYLPNGVHCQAFSDGDGQAFRQKYQIDAKKQLILCVSRIDPQKNQLALVDLLEQLVRSQGHKQGFHLLLVGPVTNSGYCQQIQQAIAHRGLDQDFTLIPGLPPGSKMLANVYRAADVFILPSVHEPFGIVVLEAWAAELPVIAASVGGLNQLISDNQTGLHFSPFNQRSLLDAFMRLQQEPKLKHRIASNGAKEACQHYSWQNYIQRLQKFYDDVESWHRSHTLTTVHL